MRKNYEIKHKNAKKEKNLQKELVEKKSMCQNRKCKRINHKRKEFIK